MHLSRMPDFLARDSAKGLLLDNMLGFGAMCCNYLDICSKGEVVMVHSLMERGYVTSYVNFCTAFCLSSLLKSDKVSHRHDNSTRKQQHFAVKKARCFLRNNAFFAASKRERKCNERREACE